MTAKYPTEAALLSLKKQLTDNDIVKVPIVLLAILLTHGLIHHVFDVNFSFLASDWHLCVMKAQLITWTADMMNVTDRLFLHNVCTV